MGNGRAEQREREKGWPGGDDSSAFVLHATADSARSLPDSDHKSRAGDAVPTAYTTPDDKRTVIHPAQHFPSPRSPPGLPPPSLPPRFFSRLLPGGFAHPFLLLASCLLSLHSRLLFLWPPAHNITASLGEFLLCVFSPPLLVSLPVSVPCESPWPLPTFISSYLFPIFFFSCFFFPSSPLSSLSPSHPFWFITRLSKTITSILQIPLVWKQRRKRTSSPRPGTLVPQPHQTPLERAGVGIQRSWDGTG